MRNRECWTHRNFRDVFIYINKVEYSGTDYLKLKVTWILKNSKQAINTNPDKIKILRKDLKNWKLLECYY